MDRRRRSGAPYPCRCPACRRRLSCTRRRRRRRRRWGSSHDAVFGVCTHPVNGLHESSVHGLPSSQLRAARPTHLPPEQVSPVVHASKSSHEAVFGVCTQPVAGSHESSVQTLPSSQLGGALPTHLPPPQMSTVVQASPSSHGAVFGVCTQPVAGLHESSVQTLPSVQLLGV